MKQQRKNTGGGSNKPPKKAYPARGSDNRAKDSRPVKSTRPARGAREAPQNDSPKIRIDIYGIHAVEAALNNPERTIHKIYVTETAEDMAYELIKAANKNGRDHKPPVLLEKQTFDRALPKDAVHQGIGVDCDPLQDVYLPDIINRAANKAKSVILLLDQVTDPHNLGAVIRSACAFGADAIIVQSRHAPELNALVAKTASGAMEHMSVVYETNLARAIENLQEHGYFALALDERGEKTIGEAPKYQKTVLVLGAEGPGLRPLVRDKCDILVKLPTSGNFSSLNVSNAAAVSLYAVLA
ncbi:MAG: 23S rRNA (guanosine(2251)-2'-O)-methyltransferase RlmB [Pseudomonadota bacterium]